MDIDDTEHTKKRSTNRLKLTTLFVAKAKAGEKRTRYYDTDAPGLVLIIESTGTKSWYMCYRRFGRPRWLRLERVGALGIADARDTVRKLKARLILNPDFDPQAEKSAHRKDMTVTDLIGCLTSAPMEQISGIT